jgi:hypothetical protein
MEGYPDPPELRGIIPQSFQHIFDKIALADNAQYLVRASYLEIYNEEIRDLLSKDPKNHLELKENIDTGLYVKDLTTFVVKNAMEIDHVMQAGKKNRSVGATLMNQSSSRSHSIFTIVVECSTNDERGDHIRVGKLNLVDLAGSERQSKTGATGDRLKEATKINLSLSALGNVISALVDGRSQHIPYRDSKLTRLLQDSLGGNTKTVMCANCGPAEYNYDETVSTLRYANRAKNIKNKPKINEDPKDAMLREFQDEIKRLKAQLAHQGGAGGGEYEEGRMGGGMVNIGGFANEEELQRLKDEAEKREAELKAQAAQDVQALLDAHARTEEEHEALREKLEAEAKARQETEMHKSHLQSALAAMEEKLIQGGEILDKAARQEAELRQAQHDLEVRKAQELTLARELANKEEGLADVEREFKDLREEVEVKTKKLRKLWGKYQQAQAEVQDLQQEFQSEREDMLDTIRELARQLKLKEVIITNFIPRDEVGAIESRAKWNEELDSFILPHLEIAGNALRRPRPVSMEGLVRPESEYARQRAQYDSNPRYKYDNILHQDLDMPERTTQEYEGPGMVSRVGPAIAMPLNGQEEEVTFSVRAPSTAPPQPYLQYEKEGSGGRQDDDDHRRSKGTRPKSAHRKRGSHAAGEGNGGHSSIEFKDDDSDYPVAKGLGRK